MSKNYKLIGAISGDIIGSTYEIFNLINIL